LPSSSPVPELGQWQSSISSAILNRPAPPLPPSLILSPPFFFSLRVRLPVIAPRWRRAHASFFAAHLVLPVTPSAVTASCLAIHVPTWRCAKGSMLGIALAVLNRCSCGALRLRLRVRLAGKFGCDSDETRWNMALHLPGLTSSIPAEAIHAPAVITSQPNFVKKVVFPLEILPPPSLVQASVHRPSTLAMVLWPSSSRRLAQFSAVMATSDRSDHRHLPSDSPGSLRLSGVLPDIGQLSVRSSQGDVRQRHLLPKPATSAVPRVAVLQFNPLVTESNWHG